MSLSLEYRTYVFIGEHTHIHHASLQDGNLRCLRTIQSSDAQALLSGAIHHHMALYPIVSFQSNEEKTAWFATFLALAGAEKELRGAL